MVPASQLDLLLSPFEADAAPVERLHRELRFVSETVTAILESLPVQRRPLSDWTKAVHIRVTLSRRNGYCPCCSSVAVVTSDGKLPGAEFDHWYARHRNGPDETWLVCGPCNRALESTQLKASVRAAFDGYQLAVKAVLESQQRELFQ